MSSHTLSNTTLCSQSQTKSSNSSMLWAHLQRKDTSSLPSSGLPVPPLAPIDKTSTSLRLLLHDTQSHFETFSDRVDQLTTSVENAKREIVQTKSLFEKEHEELGNEVYALANRCQTEILKAMGQPAQMDKLSEVQREVHLKLDGLDKRMDSMQMLYHANSQTLQSHSQVLQTHSQVLQTIQEQQGTILAALMPLLPLLQAVPLHVDTARNSVQDSISKTFAGLTIAKTTPTVSSRKRTIHSNSPHGHPDTARKRQRIDENTGETAQPSLDDRDSVVSSSRKHSSRQPTTYAKYPSVSASSSKRTPLATLAPKTPRRPLADLTLTLPRKTSVHNRTTPSFLAQTPNVTRLVQNTPRLINTSSPMLPQSNSRGSIKHDSTTTTTARNPSVAHFTPRNHRALTMHATRTGSIAMPSPLFPMPPPSLRQRRSPFRQGRRFIPLDDSDDSDIDSKEG